MGKRGKYQRMANSRTRGGREEPKAVRVLGRQRQSEVGVPATGRMIVDTDAVEACVFAAGSECRDVG
jgi:hypothetical protein